MYNKKQEVIWRRRRVCKATFALNFWGWERSMRMKTALFEGGLVRKVEVERGCKGWPTQWNEKEFLTFSLHT